MKHRLLVELEEQYYETKAQFGYDASSRRQLLFANHFCAVQEKNLSEQLTQKMKRQAAAHTDHLNKV